MDEDLRLREGATSLWVHSPSDIGVLHSAPCMGWNGGNKGRHSMFPGGGGGPRIPVGRSLKAQRDQSSLFPDEETEA